MKKGIGMKYVGCVMIGAVAILCSCRDELRPDLSPAQEGKTNIIVNLTVERSGSKSPASRSPLDPNGDEYTLGFTDAENQINSLTLIMMRIDASGNEVFEVSKTIFSPADTDKDGDYDVEFQLETNDRGVKHFYLGANLNEKHLASFRTQDKVFDAGEEKSGHNIVGALMKVKHLQGDELDGNIGEGSNIVMTAPILVENRQDITIPSGSTEETIKIDNPVKLTRTVAKVLLTCVPKSDAEEYVKVIDAKDAETNPEGDGENTGWIKLAEVNYMLNVLNRKTYLDYREDTKDDGYLIDPNYEMSNWIEKRTNDNETTYGIKDLDAYQKEFLYYDTQAMVEMLNTSIPTYQRGEPCMVRTATLYDKNRIGKEYATSRDHYTEGLYCTENTVYKDMTFANEADFQSAIRYVTTRVMVGAKYTPKVIWDGGDEPKTAKTEKEAQEILEVKDVDNPLEPVTYPAGTFWRDSKGNYYSRAGMKEKLKESPETDFSRYDGGWGYYYTYIDENAQNGAIKDTQTRWGIKRNHYYILRVEKIVAPGSPFPGNETMRIHSELVDWVDKGSSEVEIKVPQQSETAQP